MVYKAEVTVNTTYEKCYGTSEGEFNSRYNNHIRNFSDIYHIDDTELRTLKAIGLITI